MRRGRGRGWERRDGGGDRGRKGAGFAQLRSQSSRDNPQPPLGDLIVAIHNSELLEPSQPGPRGSWITNCEYVASYNWVDGKVPTIVVPGRPPAWTPLQGPQQLLEDAGSYFRDPNAARYPKFPIEPVVRAIYEIHPKFDSSSVDVVACGSTMGNLLRFVRSIDKEFRCDVEVVGNSVFFIRKELSPTAVIPDVRGFGHTFPEAYTTWEADVRGSESHQRVIRYNFEGTDCLVRFEVDGYHKDVNASKFAAEKQSRNSKEFDNTITNLSEAAGSLTVGLTPTDPVFDLAIKRGGIPVPQATIFDLKTRSCKREIDMGDVLPRLWVTQIPNFIIAYHQRGLFEDVRTEDVRSELTKWENENEQSLSRLHVIMKKIIDIARLDPARKLELCYAGSGPLEVRLQAGDTRNVLPPLLKVRWAEKHQTADEEENNYLSDEKYNDNDDFSDDDGFEKDFTACSAEDCGYCGRCSY